MKVVAVLQAEQAYLVTEEGAAAPMLLTRLRRDPKRAERDLEKVKDLRHPHVAETFGIVEFEGARYVLGEAVRAETPHGSAEAKRVWIGQIASGLAALHARGVVHGDLSPESFGFAADGTIKIACPIAASASHHAFPTRFPVYAAPDVLRGKTATPADDVFSLGAIAYEWLTGRHPFAADSIEKNVGQILFDEPLNPADLGFTGSEGSAVSLALIKLRRKRPADAASFRRLIDGRSRSVISDWLSRFGARRINDLPTPVRRVGALVLAGVLILLLLPRGGKYSLLSKEVKDLVAAKKYDEALRKISRAKKESDHPAYLRKLAGDVNCAAERWALCLVDYEAAVKEDSALGRDGTLQRNVLALVGESTLRRPVARLLTELPREIEPQLFANLTSDDYVTRWNSLRVLRDRKRESEIDYLAVYSRDLLVTVDCSVQRSAVRHLREMGDRKAIPYLREASRKIELEDNYRRCLGDLVAEAIATLSERRS